jgi:hypothetical protein
MEITINTIYKWGWGKLQERTRPLPEISQDAGIERKIPGQTGTIKIHKSWQRNTDKKGITCFS